MKQGQKWLLGIMLFSVIITLVMVQFMPDQIPVHYNATGVITRMGNKYESLIWPGIIVLMGGLFLFGTKHLKRSSDSGTKYLCVVGVGVELLFLSIGMYYMIRAVGF